MARLLLGSFLLAGCGDMAPVTPGEDDPRIESEAPLCEEEFWRGYEEGYGEGASDVRPWVTAGIVHGYDVGLERGSDSGFQQGHYAGMSAAAYFCVTDEDCVTGEACADLGGAGTWCVPPLPCQTPHPNNGGQSCNEECLSRYDHTKDYNLCVQACLCVEYLEPRRLCEDDTDCQLTLIRPFCNVERGLCGSSTETPN